MRRLLQRRVPLKFKALATASSLGIRVFQRRDDSGNPGPDHQFLDDDGSSDYIPDDTEMIDAVAVAGEIVKDNHLIEPSLRSAMKRQAQVGNQ